jgi:pantothenate kinase
MECLIRGLHYLALHCPNECYYWKDPKQDTTCKVPFSLGPNPYPYIIVNIGSGVSILLVESATSFRRIGGTSVGKWGSGGGMGVGVKGMWALQDLVIDGCMCYRWGDIPRLVCNAHRDRFL